MTASDAEAMSLRDLLSYATAEQRDQFENMWLGYTETWGAPDLREAIAGTFRNRNASDVLGFAGASEGIFAAITAQLRPHRGQASPQPRGRILNAALSRSGVTQAR